MQTNPQFCFKTKQLESFITSNRQKLFNYTIQHDVDKFSKTFTDHKLLALKQIGLSFANRALPLLLLRSFLFSPHLLLQTKSAHILLKIIDELIKNVNKIYASDFTD